MTSYQTLAIRLRQPHTLFITGVARFIGSNPLEALLRLDQKVIDLDNSPTGHRNNLTQVQAVVTVAKWLRFNFIEDDTRSLEHCQAAYGGVDYCTAPGGTRFGAPTRWTTPSSPTATTSTAFSTCLRCPGCQKSNGSSMPHLAPPGATTSAHPQCKTSCGKPLSPYAVTKYGNKLHAHVLAHSYGFNTIVLCYFNIFGKRRGPESTYAAEIHKWMAIMIKNETVYINCDVETSRDFCYINNTLHADLWAATTDGPEAVNEWTTLNQLFEAIRSLLAPRFGHLCDFRPFTQTPGRETCATL